MLSCLAEISLVYHKGFRESHTGGALDQYSIFLIEKFNNLYVLLFGRNLLTQKLILYIYDAR